MDREVMRGEGWQLDNTSAEAYDRDLAAAFAPFARALAALAEVGEGDRVLDVACGTGIVAREVAQMVGAGGRVAGLDVNDAMLRVARSVATTPPIEWHSGTATALPFDAESFDAVVCEQGLQFFSDPVAALREMHRVLVPGGRAALSLCRPLKYCPAYAALANALDRHVGPDAGAALRSPFCPWEVDQVRALFTAAGFAGAHVRIEAGALRYSSCEDFLRREAACSPFAAAVAALSDGQVRTLAGDLEIALAGHLDDDGVACGIEVYVALARKSRSE